MAVLRAVIFDFDGVLVDSEPLHFACLRDTLAHEGLTLGHEEYVGIYLAYDDRGAIRLAFEAHGQAFDRARVEAAAQRKAALFQQRLPEIHFFPGARELVRQLAAELPVGIASGALRAEIEAILEAGRLRDAFTIVVGADDVERTKPHPDPFLAARDRLAAARSLELSSNECVAFEDSVPGVAAARAAGMHVVAVTNSYPASKLTLAHRVVASLEPLTLADLQALVRGGLMTSRHLDPEDVKRQAEHRYDFTTRGLAGRVVLVPGGFGGLGAAITALLLREGAMPVVGYRKRRGHALAMQQKLQDLYGGPITLAEADVSTAEGRKACLDAALAVKGELYGLVALTGDPARVKPEDLDQAALSASFDLNYAAPVLLARACAEAMRAKGTRGAIVLLSSMQGVHPFEGSLAYAGPKAALIQAARILAKELGGATDIRVNVVAPGATSAGMARASIESGKYDRVVEQDVVPRFGRPEDVARVVRLLLEPDNYVTGQVITVDGGLTLRRDRVG